VFEVSLEDNFLLYLREYFTGHDLAVIPDSEFGQFYDKPGYFGVEL
jgi:hypothetical protein